jgi:alpha-beta hydrolase superfamily lysophospholipase
VVAAVTVGSIVAGYAIAWWVVQPPRPGGFYTAPAEVDPRPGVLLRAETIDSDVPHIDAYRILYSSRDLHDQPIAVSGLVLVPRAAAPDTGFPVVAWAHGTSGVARRCAPSLTPGSVTRTVAGAEALVGAGYLVVATDYPGLGTDGTHPYLIGDGEGRAVLDSVRAARGRPDWHAGARVAVWGHSQGGHAALFATRLAPGYAPELELVGTAVAAPATELSVLLRQDLTEPAGKVFGSIALTSWARLFPDARLSEVVRAKDRPLVAAVAASCIETNRQGLVLLPVVALMSKDFVSRDLTATEPWAGIIADNSVPAQGIDVPLFLAQGTADTVIHPEVSRDWVRGLCRHNPAVTYREYAGKDHLSVLPAAVTDVLAWVGGRFAGEPPAKACPAAGPS